MDSNQKKRAVVSYENMSKELAAAFAEKYPKGFSDYFPDLVKYDKPDGTSFYAVTLEIPDAIYLVKIKVQRDDAEYIERWLHGDDDDEDGNRAEVKRKELPFPLPCQRHRDILHQLIGRDQCCDGMPYPLPTCLGHGPVPASEEEDEDGKKGQPQEVPD